MKQLNVEVLDNTPKVLRGSDRTLQIARLILGLLETKPNGYRGMSLWNVVSKEHVKGQEKYTISEFDTALKLLRNSKIAVCVNGRWWIK